MVGDSPCVRDADADYRRVDEPSGVRRFSCIAFTILVLSAAAVSNVAVRPAAANLAVHPVPAACDVDVVLARHCDKHPPWDVHPTPPSLCTEAGLLRGENMARIFGGGGPGAGGRFPQPARLYARRMPEGTYASRDLYLLWPLAQSSKVWVNTTFSGEEVLSLAAALLEERARL